METQATIVGETDMGQPVLKKKSRGYGTWIILACGLFTTALIGGFAGSWLGNGEITVTGDISELSATTDKLVIGVEQLVAKIKADRTDELLVAISKLDQKLDVVPDLISRKIKIPECPKEEPKDCPADQTIHPYYTPDNYFFCPENECTIDIPVNTEPKEDTAVRIICVNRYGPTYCMPSLDRSVKVTRGFIKECILVNSNLKCKKELRLR